MATGNEVEGGYLSLSDPTSDEEEKDMSTETQDLEEKTRKQEIDAKARSSADHNLR